jgi:putative endonuclease
MKSKETPPDKSWVVYILRCRDNTLYTGSTNNIVKRLRTHQQGIASRYTRARLPLTLMMKSSPMSKGDALRLEMKIKNLPKEKKLSVLAAK